MKKSHTEKSLIQISIQFLKLELKVVSITPDNIT